MFGRERQRRFLLGVLIAVGAYIGIVNFFEGVGLKGLVFPTYITDPAIGLHFGRARGPFVESVADGLSLYMCAVAAAIGFSIWHRRWVRVVCTAVIVLAALGMLFTVTRAVWIGAIAGTLVAMLTMPRTRRYIPVALAIGAVGVFAALVLVPGLATKADTRLQDRSPVWDRYNTNSAALRMVEARPIFGFGWQTFPTVGPDYMRQADSYPLTGAGLEVHNVFLSHAGELGLAGATLWAVALFGAVGGSIVRRGPPELHPWRIGLIAIFVAFLVVANFGPLSYPFPNLLLWTWAGIAGAEFPSRRRVRGATPPETPRPVKRRANLPSCGKRAMPMSASAPEPPPLDLRRVLVVSPHLDDAVLSCGHLLAGAEQAMSLTVFAGRPADTPHRSPSGIAPVASYRATTSWRCGTRKTRGRSRSSTPRADVSISSTSRIETARRPIRSASPPSSSGSSGNSNRRPSPSPSPFSTPTTAPASQPHWRRGDEATLETGCAMPSSPTSGGVRTAPPGSSRPSVGAASGSRPRSCPRTGVI